jgi:hypothetical protein
MRMGWVNRFVGVHPSCVSKTCEERIESSQVNAVGFA